MPGFHLPRREAPREALIYIAAQAIGATIGTAVARLMFTLARLEISMPRPDVASPR
jgi:glycerol uptake facilitator-like aquaporin